MSAPRLTHNPPNPWRSAEVELLEPAPEAEVTVYEESAASILSSNDSPDLPFDWSLNPYRGCFHACAYCYARPSHQYLGFGAGSDFDTKIVVKTNAAELLRERLARRTWRRERIAFSGVTDCYQPLEASYGLTRACLEACSEFRTPVGIVTKGALVERDIDLLGRLTERAGADVYLSIPFADDRDSRAIEPYASPSSRRFETVRRLTAAGISVGVFIAPVIPGLNDFQIPRILQAARDAGARSAFYTLLRLPAEVREVFEHRVKAAFPERASKVMRALEDSRGAGAASHSAFGQRMRGQGARWDAMRQLFELQCRRLGLAMARRDRTPPEPCRQQELF